MKRPTILIRPFFTVKQRNLPKLVTVVSSSVAKAVRTEVKRKIVVKRATDVEGNSSESKRGAYEKMHILYYKYSVYM